MNEWVVAKIYHSLSKNKTMNFLVTKIDKDGTKNASFVLDLQGLNMLLSMATPNKCSFEIAKIS